MHSISFAPDPCQGHTDTPEGVVLRAIVLLPVQLIHGVIIVLLAQWVMWDASIMISESTKGGMLRWLGTLLQKACYVKFRHQHEASMKLSSQRPGAQLLLFACSGNV